MLATNLSEAEGTEAKLRMAFRLYDKDSSGDQDNKMIKMMIISKFTMSHGLYILGPQKAWFFGF